MRRENTVSLQEPISANDEGDSLTLEDVIPDSKDLFTPVEEKFDGYRLWEQVKAVLPPLQYKIMVYFCFGYRMRVIAKKLGIPEKTVCKMKNRAEQTLRSYKIRHRFEAFLDDWLDDNTVFIRARDYSIPVGSGSKLKSPVESVVLQREGLIKAAAGGHI